MARAACFVLVFALACGAPSPKGADGPLKPFDRAAALKALQSVDGDHCGSADGPTGKAHALVTFAGSGTVVDVVFDKEFKADVNPQGTGRGACLAAKLRELRIPPFEGAPVKVGRVYRLP